MATKQELQRLLAENSQLRQELAEANEALRAIRSGEVDALVVHTPGGERIFTLESAYEPYRTFVEHMQQGAAALSPDGLILYSNDRFGQILGVPSVTLPGASIHAVIDRTHRPLVESLLDGAATAPRDTEAVLRRPDGEQLHVFFQVTALPDGTRCVVLSDVTERVRQEALRQSEARLLEVNRAKDEFLATLSHELRTPIQAILGWAEMIRAHNLDAETRARGLQAIVRSAQAQTQLVSDMLDMSRIVSGKVRLNVQPVDLIGVVYTALDAIRPAAEAKAIAIEARVTAAPTIVAGDADRLQQVVWNLLSNAVKFTPEGGRIVVTLARSASQVVIEIRDNGAGIPRELLGRVFDRFTQGDSSIRRQHGGLGLGLSIVRHLVELHGGTAHAESEGEGKGATFTVRLPIPVEQRRPAAEQPAPPAPAAAVDGAVATPLAGARLLVVDDETDALDLLRTVLSRAGAEVTTAPSAPEALEQVRTRRFDLLVTDLGMPVQDGYQLLAAVRRLPPHEGGSLRAVALTAYSRAEDATRALDVGFESHLAKPISPEELVVAIAGLLNRGPVPRA